MKKLLTILLIVLCLGSVAYGQQYNTGIGLRAGLYNGLTVKHFTAERTAFEILLASRWHGLEITGLYEIHNMAFSTEGLYWYYGFGGHLGFWNGNYATWGDQGTSYTVVGLDGILGLEYNFREIPINLGLDWKPAFNVVGYTGFWADGGALSIRYVF